MKRVVVTGIGVVSPLGNAPGPFFDSLINARCGIGRIDAPWAASLATPYAGVARCDFEAHFPKLKRSSLDPVSMLALLAARQAAAQAGVDAMLRTDEAASENAGVYWGTGMGGAHSLETAYHEMLVTRAARLRPATIVMVMHNAATGQIGIDLNLRGPSATYSSACSSSAVAIGEAYRAIRFGLVNTAIAGGSEALLTEGVVKAWESLGTLARLRADKPTESGAPASTSYDSAFSSRDPVFSSRDPATACRPFAADRSGFLLGEGAAALVLEERDAARARGAEILGEIIGFGNTTDAGHITQPDAHGQARAMRAALAEAQLAPDQIDHINAHGTGTKVGDVTETRAIHDVFGSHAARIPVSATKALHGHLMGATGALELIAALLALRHRTAPPTAHLWHPDPECDLDYVPLTARALPQARVAMSNSFGFGGNNAVLVLRRKDA